MTAPAFKSNRGRPAGPKKDDWHISVDVDVSFYFRLLHLDTFTGKTKVGALSELCNSLLRKEMERLKGEAS